MTLSSGTITQYKASVSIDRSDSSHIFHIVLTIYFLYSYYSAVTFFPVLCPSFCIVVPLRRKAFLVCSLFSLILLRSKSGERIAWVKSRTLCVILSGLYCCGFNNKHKHKIVENRKCIKPALLLTKHFQLCTCIYILCSTFLSILFASLCYIIITRLFLIFSLWLLFVFIFVFYFLYYVFCIVSPFVLSLSCHLVETHLQ